MTYYRVADRTMTQCGPVAHLDWTSPPWLIAPVATEGSTSSGIIKSNASGGRRGDSSWQTGNLRVDCCTSRSVPTPIAAFRVNLGNNSGGNSRNKPTHTLSQQTSQTSALIQSSSRHGGNEWRQVPLTRPMQFLLFMAANAAAADW